MKNIPRTTLFMISSLDGKISSGDSDALDVDKDWKKIHGVKEGLPQYYDLEQHTDIVSFNTGRVMKKIGVNTRTDSPTKIPVSFVLVDNKPHLNKKGLTYLSKWLRHVYLVTTNKKHPAYAIAKDLDNVTILPYTKGIDFTHLFQTLKTTYKINRMTIQSGGTMNTHLLRQGLIESVSLVVAPLLVGGKDTATLLDGESIHTLKQLPYIKALKLLEINKLKHSYLHLIYKVIPDTKISK